MSSMHTSKSVDSFTFSIYYNGGLCLQLDKHYDTTSFPGPWLGGDD